MVKTSLARREFVGITEIGQTRPTRLRMTDNMSLAGLRGGLLAQRSDLSGIM